MELLQNFKALVKFYNTAINYFNIPENHRHAEKANFDRAVERADESLADLIDKRVMKIKNNPDALTEKDIDAKLAAVVNRVPDDSEPADGFFKNVEEIVGELVGGLPEKIEEVSKKLDGYDDKIDNVIKGVLGSIEKIVDSKIAAALEDLTAPEPPKKSKPAEKKQTPKTEKKGSDLI